MSQSPALFYNTLSPTIIGNKIRSSKKGVCILVYIDTLRENPFFIRMDGGKMFSKLWDWLKPAVGFLVIASVLAACTPPAASALETPVSPAASPTAKACNDPGGMVTIKVHDWSTADRRQYWDQVIQAFSQAHPCIQVETINLPEDRAVRLKELAEGTAPDLVGFDSSDLPLVARQGYLLDLTSVMAKDHFNPEEAFYDSVYKTGFVDGKPVGIAKDYSVSAFYVNTDMLKKAGLALPKEGWTYDDYLKMAQKLTLDNAGNNATSPEFNPNKVTVWGTLLGEWVSDSGWWRGYQSFLYSWGAHTISPDGKTTTGYLNSDKAVEAWTWYRDLIHKYHVSPTVSYLNDSGVSNDKLFSQGKIAIAGNFWGPWYQDTFNQVKGLNWTVVPLPTGPGGHHAAIMWMGWGINAKSKHPDQAWQLLKWLTTDPGQTVFALKALTGDKSVAKTLQLDTDPFWGVFLREVPYQDNLDDMTTPFYTTCVDIPAGKLLGKMFQDTAPLMNIKSELDKLAASADKCLAESKIQ